MGWMVIGIMVGIVKKVEDFFASFSKLGEKVGCTTVMVQWLCFHDNGGGYYQGIFFFAIWWEGRYTT